MFESFILYNNPNSSNIRIPKGIKYFEGKPVLRWINFVTKITQIQYVFDPPGSYADNSEGIKVWLKFLKYFLRGKVLKLLNIKLARVGMSVGPLSTKGMVRQRKLSQVYHLWGLRDSSNFEELQLNGFANLLKVEDLAYLFERNSFECLSAKKKKMATVCLSFRGAVHSSNLDDHYISGIIQFLKGSKDFLKDKKVLFAYQVEEDRESCILLRERLQTEGVESEMCMARLTMSEALLLYSNVEYVLTNRLHVALLALLCETIAFAVTDVTEHKKLVNIYKDMGLEMLIVDIYNSDKVCIDENILHSITLFSQIKEQKQSSLKSVFSSKL